MKMELSNTNVGALNELANWWNGDSQTLHELVRRRESGLVALPSPAAPALARR